MSNIQQIISRVHETTADTIELVSLQESQTNDQQTNEQQTNEQRTNDEETTPKKRS